MQSKDYEIEDIWFRSGLSLSRIAELLELTNAEYDSENVWEWVIGDFRGVKLDITREHSRRRHLVDVRIFRIGADAFDEELKNALIQRLSNFIRGGISCGKWHYLSGDDFRLEVHEWHPTK